MTPADSRDQNQLTPLPAIPESFLPNEHALYRPRHSERQRGARIAATVFFLTPLVLLGLGVRPPEFENRPLASFPSPADGFGFFTSFDRWSTDHLPLRDVAVRAADGVSRGVFGEPYPFGQKHSSGAVPGAVPAPPQDESLDGVEIPRASGFPVVVEGSDGWLYLGYDVQVACQPARPLDEVIAKLNKLRAGVEASGRKFVLVVPPNKATAAPANLGDDYLGAKCYQRARDEFWRRLAPETGALDLRADLDAAAREVGRPVYAKNDTHWTHEGGIVMTRAIAEAVQPGSTKNWRITKTRAFDLVGDLPKLLGRTQRWQVQEYDLAPDGKEVRSHDVNDTFKEPKRLTQPAGSGGVAPKVGLIGDSFTFLVNRYLAGGFSDITMVHGDVVESDPAKVGRMLADQDVVVLEAVERTLVGGINPVLSDENIDALLTELAKRPRR
ncbi:alginate O-acetyltransferase AlgX-related protein [Saccharothrix variisporea]|uniref:Acetyltransferase AlgX (SGNH hydrolase-like protein) n=1 Tax=Saccharothrix variisporea TaxID=543527 RepID=A0A495XAF9_9PSEU|nr:hypothetical protein [Saccharothrix variisporea]RKT71471.1 acetyltransferase AlgX (SGNH hydrolase-like protein) [Saccharothrix variisporea]